MFGAMMFVSKLALEAFPNWHLIAVFTIAFTVVYRYKALIPVYVFVLLTGIYNGFAVWWVPYLYIWTVLWGVAMLLPKKMPLWLSPIVYCIVAALHGLSYGALYSPYQALAFGYSFKQTLAWIAAGFPWDVTHAIGNAVLGVLIVPLILLLKKLNKRIKI